MDVAQMFGDMTLPVLLPGSTRRRFFLFFAATKGANEAPGPLCGSSCSAFVLLTYHSHRQVINDWTSMRGTTPGKPRLMAF